MRSLAQLCEDIRDAVDDEGGGRCFDRSLEAFQKETGLPVDGLWAVVDGVVAGAKPAKLLNRLHKSWGGDMKDWIRWYKLAATKPDCS